MKLESGNTLTLEAQDEHILLCTVRAKAMLKKALGALVFQGEPTNISIPGLIDKDRDERAWEFQK